MALKFQAFLTTVDKLEYVGYYQANRQLAYFYIEIYIPNKILCRLFEKYNRFHYFGKDKGRFSKHCF